MNKPRVDPAEFRLRLFEDQWLGPLENAYLAEHASVDHLGRHAIAATLLVEARQWRWLGARCGYFPPDDIEDPTAESVSAAPTVREIAEIIRSSAADTATRIGVVDFASAVSTARDDLSADRKEFLRILVFADESDWDMNLRHASEFADELASDHWSSQPARVLEDVAWCLEGPMSALRPGSTQLPSAWRTDLVATGRRVHAPVVARLEQLADVRRRIVRSAPFEFRSALGGNFQSAGASELGVAIWPADFDPVSARDRVVEYQKLARLREQSADYGESARLYDSALQLLLQIAGEERLNLTSQREIADTHLKLAEVQALADQPDAAEQHYVEASSVMQHLLDGRPDDSDLARALAFSHFRLGSLHEAVAQYDQAQQNYMAAIALENQLLAATPDDADVITALAVLHSSVGDVLRSRRDETDAVTHYSTALSLLQRHAEASGLDESSGRQAAGVLMRLGSMLAAAGDEQTAAQHFLNADRLRRDLESGSG